MDEISTDVLIIGAGPAGLAAAIYTGRSRKKTVVLKGRAASHLMFAKKVENYPGVKSISGEKLLDIFEKQALSFDVEIINDEAIELSLGSDPKLVATRNGIIKAKTVILAMGKGELRKTIKNEANFLGLGVSYCAVCDGPFYRGKKVFVYGNDEEALRDTIMLKQLGCDTALVSYCRNKNCPDILIEQAKEKGVEIYQDTEITDIKGNGTISEIIIKNKDGQKTLPADGLFIIQSVPSIPLLKKAGINLTNKDCVAVDKKMHTNLPGVFSAGDINCGGLQIAVAIGEGVTAALNVINHIDNKR
jgi:thioredoxin reductase (NADPH)